MTTLDASPVEPWAVKTSPFGPRNGRNHNGTDLGSPDPSRIPIYGAGVYAPFDGTVTTGYEANGAGNWIWVTRNDGLLFKCFHLSAYAVQSGPVKAGQLIGRVGNTGASSGAHWHIELWSGGRPFDPWPAISEVMTRTPEPPAVEPTPEPKDWLDMATEAEVEAIVRRVVQEEIGNQDKRMTAAIVGPLNAVLDQLDPRRNPNDKPRPIRDLVEPLHSAAVTAGFVKPLD